MRKLHMLLVMSVLALGLGACGAGDTGNGTVLPTPGAAPTVPLPPPTALPPSPAPTPAPTSAAAPSAPASPAAGVVVTLKVADAETYKILLTDPADIAAARKLLAGQEAPRIPNGKIVRGDPGVNTGYSWHIDPASVEFVDMTTEVCDGRPSDVEKQLVTSNQFCPWNAQVIAVEDAGAPTAQAPADTAVLVSLHRSGGIAGLDETISVYADGRVERRGRGGQTQTAQASPADLDALRALLASPELAQVQDRYQASGADLFTYELTLPGDTTRTIRTMDGAKHPAILSRLIGALVKLRPAA